MQSRLILSLAALGATLLLVEIGLRVTALGDLRGLHEVVPGRPWLYRLKPNAERRIAATGDVAYRTNSEGFRDREWQAVKPADSFRVLVLGDSITFGYGVELEDTFPSILEQDLARVWPGRTVEVLNLGVSGYNPYTEAALFAELGERYAPDLVIAQLCVNDLNDPTMHFDASTMAALDALPDEAFPDPGTRQPPPSLARRLCSESELCSGLPRGLGVMLAGRAELTDALAPHERPSDREIAWLERSYAAIAREAERLGATFVLAIFPYQTQRAPGAPAEMQRRVLELAERRGWVAIDLLPAFRDAAARSTEPLFLDMWHPTTAGQHLAAKTLLAALVARGLVPAGEPAHTR